MLDQIERQFVRDGDEPVDGVIQDLFFVLGSQMEWNRFSDKYTPKWSRVLHDTSETMQSGDFCGYDLTRKSIFVYLQMLRPQGRSPGFPVRAYSSFG